ncbi:hypothetical protein [Paenibacillus sp. 1P07SE]|uniref:hypothetical protein n=1 Tax=Paenibacillus sp. 1P07SE TaxID=3132209 RepID=UPI0039A5668F
MAREKEIHIVLTDTGTVLNRAIRWCTKDPLNHASIAFDRELREVYSFGRKSPGNPLIGGFVQEDMYGRLFRDASCAIYSCRVSEQVYDRIRRRVRAMHRKQELYTYNFVGLFALLLNIEWRRNRAYFCSQFVAYLFESSGMPLVNKSPLMTTPGDLARARFLRLEYEGKLQHYAFLGESAMARRPAAASRLRRLLTLPIAGLQKMLPY